MTKGNKIIAGVIVGSMALVGGYLVGSERGFEEAYNEGYEKAQTELVFEHVELRETVVNEIIKTSETAHKNLKEIAEAKGLKEFKKEMYTFSNGSTLVAYPQLERFYFMPYELGDWDYELTNKEDAENIVKTYISMKGTGQH